MTPKKKKKTLEKSGKQRKPIVGRSLLVLFQAPPHAQESEEGVPIDKVKQQGRRVNNKVTKQEWGGARNT